MGTWEISEKQSQKLDLEKRSRWSPQVVKMCLLLSANVSYENASRDLKEITGIYVSYSTQQRLVHRQEFPDAEVSEEAEVTALSADGGKVRLRTAKGQPSEWRDYKAVSWHGFGCAAFFNENDKLAKWVNQQPLAEPITCLGDGHPGVWNLIDQIAIPTQRREILDWYHLKENLYKVGGSNQRLNSAEYNLWHGDLKTAQSCFDDWDVPQAQNFVKYLEQHGSRSRIPDSCTYQSLGITIGSGAVESTIKRIGLRVKLSGAQWNRKNVPQVLKHRCFYLNLASPWVYLLTARLRCTRRRRTRS